MMKKKQTIRTATCFAWIGLAASALGQAQDSTSTAKCPVMGTIADPTARHTAAGHTSNRDWWPNQLNLQILHQNSAKSNPMGEDFDYAKEFKSLDLNALRSDIKALLTP